MHKQIKFKKNLIFKRILFLVMLAATFYVIFNFSAQDGEVSGSVSRKVTTFIVEMLSKVKNMDVNLKLHYIAKLEPIVRKLAHFSMYTIVGFSVMGFMCTFDIRNITKFITSICIGVTYAISDEIHQMFSGDRIPAIRDVFIDYYGMAGSAKQKAEELNNMFKDPSIDLIMCLDGGDSCNTIIDYLDY